MLRSNTSRKFKLFLRKRTVKLISKSPSASSFLNYSRETRDLQEMDSEEEEEEAMADTDKEEVTLEEVLADLVEVAEVTTSSLVVTEHRETKMRQFLWAILITQWIKEASKQCSRSRVFGP